ncbi:hypothetical protein [Cellulophaga sp. Hel_I_12]|uniref:hypothetical protein n=1 Tax=Cellulophaga sp. Hel_I_12 TaxID=1249972 RepID=UPI0006482421|nr:hypothetical protein [Cellulophaga sp. Hel_I_12]
MKHFFLILVLGLFILSLNSCSSYKNKLQTAAITFPELGSFVKIKGDFWYQSQAQIGILNYEQPLLVSAKAMPFNKASYNKYTNYLKNANRINSVSYTDSMPFKPKYIRLELLDKIELTDLLNNDINNGVRSYLENDRDYKLVTSIDITITDKLRSTLMQAETILLQKDARNKLTVFTVNNNQKIEIDFSHFEVFEYSYVSFCWGADRYHNKIIKALVQKNEACPRDTYTKASKIKSKTKSYLKL